MVKPMQMTRGWLFSYKIFSKTTPNAILRQRADYMSITRPEGNTTTWQQTCIVCVSRCLLERITPPLVCCSFLNHKESPPSRARQGDSYFPNFSVHIISILKDAFWHVPPLLFVFTIHYSVCFFDVSLKGRQGKPSPSVCSQHNCTCLAQPLA